MSGGDLFDGTVDSGVWVANRYDRPYLESELARVGDPWPAAGDNATPAFNASIMTGDTIDVPTQPTVRNAVAIVMNRGVCSATTREYSAVYQAAHAGIFSLASCAEIRKPIF